MPDRYWQERILKNQETAEKLADKAVQRMEKLHIDLYKDLAKEVDSLFIEVVNAGTQNITRTQLWQFSKYKSLMNSTYTGFTGLTRQQISIMESVLEEVFYQTIGITLEQLNRKDIAFNVFHSKQMMHVLNENWSGSNYSSRIWKSNSAIADRVREDITRLVLEGKNPTKIKAALMEDFNVSFSNADRIVRTEEAYVFSEASKAAYVEAGVQFVEFMIERDNVTCEKCLDIRDTDVGHGRGIYPINSIPTVPAHPRCRCCYAPIVNLNPSK